MQLKYLKGETTYYMGHPVIPYRFAPIGEIPEKYGNHLLKTYPNDFVVYVEQAQHITEDEPKEEVKKEVFTCDICGKEFNSNAGMRAHQTFKHKEKK